MRFLNSLLFLFSILILLSCNVSEKKVIEEADQEVDAKVLSTRKKFIGTWALNEQFVADESKKDIIARFELKADSTAQIHYGTKVVEGKWNIGGESIKIGKGEAYLSGDLILQVYNIDKHTSIFSFKLDSLVQGIPLTIDNGKYKKL
ncbi:hypothetical protein IFO69_09130 [Echinicola sp. CAU 1574]|uniref:Lipocalin-like domain-containing protein n=1 Tax=Echinicola arenosa TaxID=2774144 RepID=A0ABR9AJL8_9BACT|nr:hypothetical protein [Echinicola arenosa]MBD8488905.1 hypothetical protein [Echinicola arenosa]